MGEVVHLFDQLTVRNKEKVPVKRVTKPAPGATVITKGRQKVIFFGNHINYLAKSLKACKPEGVMDEEVWRKIVHTVAHDLNVNNPLFEPARFYKSCGMEEVEAS